MSKASSIDSLAELHARQLQVKQETEAAKEGLVGSLAQAPGKMKQFAYEDLAIPAMGVGLAIYVGYRLLRSNDAPQVSNQAPMPAPQPTNPAPMIQSAPTGNIPSPQYQAPRPVNRSAPQASAEGVAKSGLNFKAIISAGKLLIPAAKAIMSAVQEHKAQQAKDE
ncbi:MAG: hypothetical protein AB8H12_03595 [Lewinella sp.]